MIIWDNDFYDLVIENFDTAEDILEELVCGYNPFFAIGIPLEG